ncbi:CDP-diacylglycerol--glycerol-3-phosphate 3-phosphatidyltransferase [Verrucomicrobium sp. GAS474]|uniref:CDP-diacylglycerol--glycerol-3-phosphate 3-phosphatidyltransferase n=1 Tax=Verrucomicrobium sp. GAS474 TaxID=1882831 RepID=UPI00087A72F2|nr:CDP-diacylglycerol--glycerol-3-phosphate 3-phosphatidyltransferase [Verrucomicrobium sp. GAS474]SDU26645.1 CDP-diacylglycerol--glycerol-3-phosphate 3-phosphatidyltransferase [Verrucomicrobium sp. GAS474]
MAKPLRFTLNLPNQLSLGRLVLCAFFVAALSIDFSFRYTVALAIFVVASLTDWLDGYIARKQNIVTDLGKLLDPLADKILVSAAFVGMIGDDYGAPMWMVVTIIAREFLITGLRIVAANRGYLLAAEKAGKHKTISQMVFVIVSLFLAATLEMSIPDGPIITFLDYIQPALLWIALGITLLSGWIYFWKNRGLFAVEDEVEEKKGDAPAPSPAAPVKEPAFKEWQAVVTSLGAGRQALILRKGGIAEGKSGFSVKHRRFWLLPTRFHQQGEKLLAERLPAGAIVTGGFEEVPASGVDTVRVEFFAEVTHVAYLTEWSAVAALAPFHPWKEEVIRERFEWKEPGIHAFLVRVRRLREPKEIVWEKGFDGCKSWVEVPVAFSSADPVLDEAAYRAIVGEIGAALPGTALAEI